MVGPVRVQLSRKKKLSEWRNSPDRPRAKCHPEKPHSARGMCHSCYQRWLFANSPRFQETKQTSVNASNKRYRMRNPDKVKEQKLGKLYGISLAEYEQMLADQGRACALCKEPTDRTLHVDHCHETGKVRGLLCLPCNGMLAWVERVHRADDDWIQRALQYLGEKA